jgi:hypothetical protein
MSQFLLLAPLLKIPALPITKMKDKVNEALQNSIK